MPERPGGLLSRVAPALVMYHQPRSLHAEQYRAFRTNLAKGKATASSVRGRDPRFAADRMLDGDPKTYWAAEDAVTTASLDLDLGRETEFDTLLVQEQIALGQRVKQFSVEIWDGAAWRSIARQTTIGYKRILRFPAVRTNKLRLRIDAAKACPTISNLELYLAER